MLGHLVANASRLVRPYMEPILKVCLFVCALLVAGQSDLILPQYCRNIAEFNFMQPSKILGKKEYLCPQPRLHINPIMKTVFYSVCECCIFVIFMTMTISRI